MNKLLSKHVLSSAAVTSRWSRPAMSPMQCRSVTYDVLPTGEKVVVNKYPKRSSKREDWQRVRPMGYEPRLRKLKIWEQNDRITADPRVARNTAASKLQSMKDDLLNRGFCRETKPYEPPKDVYNIIESVCRQVFESQTQSKNWSQNSLSDRIVKFKFLTKCNEELNHEIPNSMLYLMRTVSDVVEYYSTPIRGITSYDQMVQNSDQLPQNLHVIGEPLRFNPETDTFFGGISAYPFHDQRVKGLRATKKYPVIKGHFKWPDV
ncbi:unnamed protein product [Medioppia subpectinata]|uniref:Large ribosomal subunit protein mL50 n=1 Tax=Medioppia subpectinata TaxID=1979941 RepID=A0A7R9KIH3_9ACAR|nr:unnamed protein product [Medioppia subpectinata]CAG2102786.1 unnamed protein product [Medioppia subpectinata]